MKPREQRLVIILADISGYTKFMVENQLSAVHGQMVITYLIESLLREVDIPLQLQEIEGDALFLYATRPDDEPGWEDVLVQVRTKLLRFFKVFIESMVGMGEMTPCKCAVCTHLDELRLKLIVHSGRAVFHTIGRLPQVSGADVILAHRLLKNSVPDKEYLLLSDAAYRDLGQDMGLDFQDGQETYDSFGTVKTHVHFLGGEINQARDRFYALESAATKAAIHEYVRAGIPGSLRAAIQQFRRPATQAGPVQRVLFVLTNALVTFIMLFRLPGLAAKKLESNRALRAQSSPGGGAKP
jgi:hypothetical protein